MTIVVTGGAGFIGSNFVYYLLEHHPEDRVVCLDKLTYAGNLSTLAPVMEHPQFRFVKADICDRAGVYRLFEEEHPDIVVNFAAESHVDRSIENPEVFLQTNIIGTSVLMDACRKYGIGRYHQVSTDEVYGDLPLDRPDLFFTEETPIHTSSPYCVVQGVGGSAGHGIPPHLRTAGDHLALLQQLRPVSLSGEADPADDHQRAGGQAASGVRRGPECARLAVCRGSLQGHRPDHPQGHGSARCTTSADTTKCRTSRSSSSICKALGKPESLITHVADRKGHDMRYAIDPTKIHNELGWLPETKFAGRHSRRPFSGISTTGTGGRPSSRGEYQNYYDKMYGSR